MPEKPIKRGTIDRPPDNFTVTTDTDPAPSPLPQPEAYLPCTCGAILGYIAHVGKARVLFAYAYAPCGPRDAMEARRINARIYNGDVFCPHCSRWFTFAPGTRIVE